MGWKLVRDDVEKAARADGVTGTWRPAEPEEIIPALTAKLFEETGEFVQGTDVAELYDLLDVTQALIDRLDPFAEGNAAHAAKVARLGGFAYGVLWHPVPGAEKSTP